MIIYVFWRFSFFIIIIKKSYFFKRCCSICSNFKIFVLKKTIKKYFYHIILNKPEQAKKKGIDGRGNWRAASPPLPNYMNSSTLPLPDTKYETKKSLKNMCVFSCRFLALLLLFPSFTWSDSEVGPVFSTNSSLEVLGSIPSLGGGIFKLYFL